MGVAQPLTDRRAPLTPAQEDMIAKLRRHYLETSEPLLRYAEWHKLIVRGLLRGGWVENYPPASLRSYKFQLTPLGIEMADELIAIEKDRPAEPDPTAARLLAFRLVTDDMGWQKAVAEWEITCAHCDERVARVVLGWRDGIPEAPRFCSRRCNDRSKESRKRRKERQEERAAAKERAGVERGRLRELTEAARPVGLKSVPTPAVLAPKPTPVPKPVPAAPPAPAPVAAPRRPGRARVDAYAGVEWLPRALEAAMHRGVADTLARIVATYQLHGSMLGVGPEPGYTDGRVRIRSGAYYATVGKDGVVLAFGERETEHGSRGRVHKTASSARRGTHTRSPRTWVELDAWIVEEGYEVRSINGGHRGVFRDGVRISTLPTSASDHRSLANSIAELRKQGLTLRK
jgi:hypothetical protein